MVATSEGMIQPSAVLDAYFDEAAAQFAAARSNAGAGPDRDFQLAGQTLALRFAGPALAGRILPAFGHHPPGDLPDPAFSVLLWDSASTGTMLPPPPWGALEYHERGNMRAHDSERYSLSFDRPTDVFVAVDLKRRLGLFWTRDARQLPSFDTAAPLRRLLQGWLRSRLSSSSRGRYRPRRRQPAAGRTQRSGSRRQPCESAVLRSAIRG